MKKLYFVLLGLLFISVACTHKSFTPALSSKDTSAIVNPPKDTSTTIVDTTVCFQRDVLPIFVGSCAKAGCHDAVSHEKGYLLTDYAHIVSFGIVKFNSLRSKLYTECLSGAMPEYPTPKLDSTQLSYIRRWIDAGALNDTNCTASCDTTKFTFAASIAPMLKTNCYGCHASSVAASSGDGIILDTYTSVQIQALNGNLFGDLSHAAGHNFMPQGGSELPACQLTQIKKWIDAGALNN